MRSEQRLEHHVMLTEAAWCAWRPVGGAIVVKLTPDWRSVAQLVADVTLECTDCAVDARL